MSEPKLPNKSEKNDQDMVLVDQIQLNIPKQNLPPIIRHIVNWVAQKLQQLYGDKTPMFPEPATPTYNIIQEKLPEEIGFKISQLSGANEDKTPVFHQINIETFSEEKLITYILKFLAGNLLDLPDISQSALLFENPEDYLIHKYHNPIDIEFSAKLEKIIFAALRAGFQPKSYGIENLKQCIKRLIIVAHKIHSDLSIDLINKQIQENPNHPFTAEIQTLLDTLNHNTPLVNLAAIPIHFGEEFEDDSERPTHIPPSGIFDSPESIHKHLGVNPVGSGVFDLSSIAQTPDGIDLEIINDTNSTTRPAPTTSTQSSRTLQNRTSLHWIENYIKKVQANLEYPEITITEINEMITPVQPVREKTPTPPIAKQAVLRRKSKF